MHGTTSVMDDTERGLAPRPTVSFVLKSLARRPMEHLIRRWNWKSAFLSSLTRGAIFFAVNLVAGWQAALGALLVEFAYRSATAGFYGAITEAFRDAQPEWAATATTMVLLPAVSHTLEFLVHWSRGTPKLGLSIGISVAFTAVSTAFNLHAMRQGVLVVGQGRRPLVHDLRLIPALILSFVMAAARGVARGLRAIRGRLRRVAMGRPCGASRRFASSKARLRFDRTTCQ
jgi:hypothetical protein